MPGLRFWPGCRASAVLVRVRTVPHNRCRGSSYIALAGGIVHGLLPSCERADSHAHERQKRTDPKETLQLILINPSVNYEELLRDRHTVVDELYINFVHDGAQRDEVGDADT